MGNCEVKTGFFILRNCGNPTMHQCQGCGKNICSMHMRGHPETSEPYCLDCLSEIVENKNQQDTVKGKTEDKSMLKDDYYYDSMWSYGFRRSFYSRSGYTPVGGGSNNHTWDEFGENDIKAFDKVDAENEFSEQDYDDSQSVFDS